MTDQDQTHPARDVSFTPPGRADAPVGPGGRAAPPVWTRRSIGVMVVGALLAGGVAGGTLALNAGPPQLEIEQVAPAEIGAATLSFPPAEIGTHIEDAKSCRVPLAFVTLVPRDGSTGRIRIRSGDYWTPVIHLGTSPLRVALPYPAPYPTGIGQFVVESDGAAFNMYLRPGWVSGPVNGSATVHVWWHVRAPC